MATIRKLKKIAFPTSGGTAVFDSDDFVYSVNNIKPNVANGDVHIDRVNNANHSDAATNIDQKVSASAATNTAFPTNSSYVPDMSFLSYWNGAYGAQNQSNLKYCYQGEIIGSSNIAQQSVSHAVTSDRSTNANYSDRSTNANHSDAATTVDRKISASAATSTAFPTNSSYVPDMSFLSYWNGAYSAQNQSNLKYCYQGEIIGSSNIAQQSVSHAVTSDRSGNAYNDENGNNINGTYVKLGVSQNITAQHNFPNGVRINGYLVTIE